MSTAEDEHAKPERLVAILGSVLLLAAPFTPFISSPGNPLSMLSVRPDASYLLIAFSMVAFFSAIYGLRWLGWCSGLAGVNASWQVFQYREHILPGRLADWQVLGVGLGLRASDFNPDYGVVIIMMGIGLSFTAAYRSRRAHRSTREV